MRAARCKVSSIPCWSERAASAAEVRGKLFTGTETGTGMEHPREHLDPPAWRECVTRTQLHGASPLVNFTVTSRQLHDNFTPLHGAFTASA